MEPGNMNTNEFATEPRRHRDKEKGRQGDKERRSSLPFPLLVSVSAVALWQIAIAIEGG
jgi:hypothetical protein